MNQIFIGIDPGKSGEMSTTPYVSEECEVETHDDN